MDDRHLRTVMEMQTLTREYASYSQSRSGLGNVLGGLAGVLSCLAMWHFGAGLLTTGVTVGLTTAWLLGREPLRHRLYRPFGDADERWSEAARRQHRHWSLVLGVLGVACAAVLFARFIVPHPGEWKAYPYLIVCLAAPPITWRWLRTGAEATVGLYLLLACAITAAGFVPDRYWTVTLLLFSLTLLALGLREHRQFQTLAGRLRPPVGGGT